MKILLFGEYSGFYNALKAGLQKQNHEVLLVGRSDGFKKYSLDISFDPIFFNYKIPAIIRRGFYKIFNSDIADLEMFFRFLIHKKKLQNFDVVQLINEFPFQIHPFLEKICLKYIFKQNGKVYLSACSDDFVYINFLLENKLKYHVLSPYLQNNNLKPFYKHSLMYLKKRRKLLHNYVFENIKAVIPTDMDYFMAYKNHPKATSIIPYPINTDKLEYKELLIGEKIIIFHGVNSINYYKKGNDYFEKALEIIQKKYPEKVSIITAKNMPYSEYIQKYDCCHILLDQVLSYDQGYNALEAMAKGKIVFTGAEKEFKDHYNLNEKIALNSVPNVSTIVEELSNLIEHPESLITISQKARAFVTNEHNYRDVAQKYINLWSS